jgi:hypothetical protein
MCSVYHESRDLSSVFNVLRVIQQALHMEVFLIIMVDIPTIPSKAPAFGGKAERRNGREMPLEKRRRELSEARDTVVWVRGFEPPAS